MAYWANIDGERIVSGSIQVPRHCAWTADFMLADDVPVGDGIRTITVGDLVLKGTIVRTLGFAGSRTVRVVGGAGGWGKTLPPRAYSNPAGITLSMLLGDASLENGETVKLASDLTIGTYYVREAAPGQRLLRQLVGLGWFIDSAGVTQIGTRPTGAITSEFVLMQYAGAKGQATIATELLADWMPGRSFSTSTLPTPKTISSVRMSLAGDGKVRLEVMTDDAGDDDRWMQPFRELVRAEFPQLGYLGRFEYVVQDVAPSGATVSASPVTAADRLPGIVDAPLWPGIIGEQAKPKVGSKCLVEFVGGDPRRPIVTGGDPNAPPDVASSTKLAGGGPKAARVGDTIRLTDADIAKIIAPSGGGPCTLGAGTHVEGTITTGSTKVEIG